MLEIGGKEKEYNKLKFYCDWALHSQINNIGAVRDVLDGIIARNTESGLDLTLQFKTFREEFKRFLQDNQLSTTIYDSEESRFRFEMYLSHIYTDTPLIVDGKIKIQWYGQIGEKSFGGSFKILDLTKPSIQDPTDLIAPN